jgi:hypothetical protein
MPPAMDGQTTPIGEAGRVVNRVGLLDHRPAARFFTQAR